MLPSLAKSDECDLVRDVQIKLAQSIRLDGDSSTVAKTDSSVRMKESPSTPRV